MARKMRKRRRLSRCEESSPNISLESIESITDVDQSTSSIPDPSTKPNTNPELKPHTGIKQIFEQFRNTSERQDKKQRSVNIHAKNSSLWCEKYFPKCESDICVNKQKLNQVKEAIGDLIMKRGKARGF